MKDEELRRLLRRLEDPSLEFKREWYKVNDPDSNIKNRQRAELIKDVLALANGSPSTAGKKSYLIIGADEQLGPDGNRILHDVGNLLPDRKQILEMISAACDPELEDIEIEAVPIDGIKILVITIPASPYLYETTRELTCSQGKFNEYIVFIRRGEIIGIASAKERTAILQLKQIRFNELKNAPPVRFGMIVGAIIGGSLVITIADKVFGNTPARAVGFLLGTVIFGGFGAAVGVLYKELSSVRNAWQRIKPLGQALIILTSVGMILFWLMNIWTQIVR
jgi:hypothetical protein